MAWSKAQLIATAFEEIGVANYEFDLQPEQIEGALRRLDTLMATWNAVGIRIGYNQASEPGQSDPNQDSGIRDEAVQAVIANLAVRLGPTIGKQVSRETKGAAVAGYNALLSRVASLNVREQQFPQTLPVGAGNRRWSQDEVFNPTPVTPLTTNPDSDLEFRS